MVLAAGFGERMEPLSTVVPKPALDILGHPLLTSAVSRLGNAGCGRIVVNIHRHPEQVAAAARAACQTDLSFSWEPELLGSAGGVSAARPLLGEGPVLVGNADIWGDVDLQPLVAAGEDEIAVLALVLHPDPGRWSSVVVAADGRVESILAPGVPHSGERFLFTGFQLLGAKVLASWPAPPGRMADVWDELRGRGALRSAVVCGSWFEAGTPAAYRTLVVDLLGRDPWVHPAATVAQQARVVRSAVGAGCRVAEGSAVSECVLTAGATVEGGCDLRSCVVAGSVTVRECGSVSDALFLPHGRYPLL